MRILAAIANYGTKNRAYLEQLLAEYRSMAYPVDLVVLSERPKDLGPDVQVRVGLPDKDPWSLPFGHRQLFADRLDDYDLFLYSEDDVLIRQRNIEAYLEMTSLLPDDYIVGFLRYEEGIDGRWCCPDVHAFCHWVPGSVRQFGSNVFARLTNEHSACYLLTRAQLRRAIASGGFLVPPHQGFYDLLCTAATDPYTQCGFTRVLCLTRIEDFMVHHLPDAYVGQLGLTFDEVRTQIDTLFRCLKGELTCEELLPPESPPNAYSWSKSYSEPRRDDVLDAVPPDAKQVLSIGCGTGTTEAALVGRGCRVVGVPLDAIVGETARARGIEVTPPNFQQAFDLLSGAQFDCILFIDVLQYTEAPPALLARSGSLLADQGILVVAAPNLDYLGYRMKRTPGRYAWRAQDTVPTPHMQRATPRLMTEWLHRSGLRLERLRYDENSRFRWLVRVFPGVAGPCLSPRFVLIAGKPRPDRRR